MIPTEILEKYGMQTLDELLALHESMPDVYPDEKTTELDFYKGFLEKTDHIPNKIIEAQVLGTTVDDYTELLQYRQYARDEINRLQAETEADNTDE